MTSTSPVLGTGTGPAPDHRTGGRGRALLVVGAGGAALAVALARLHATGGQDVLPVPLCPLHAATGLWCPLCGSLRAVAALTRLDVGAALSSNLLVTLLLPLLAAAALGPAVAALTGRPHRVLAVGNRTWVVLGMLFGVFAVWRNLPALPLGAWLAP